MYRKALSFGTIFFSFFFVLVFPVFATMILWSPPERATIHFIKNELMSFISPASWLILLIPLVVNSVFHRRFVAVWNTVFLFTAFMISDHLSSASMLLGISPPALSTTIIKLTLFCSLISLFGFVVSSVGRWFGPLQRVQASWERLKYSLRVIAYVATYMFVIGLPFSVLGVIGYIGNLFSPFPSENTGSLALSLILPYGVLTVAGAIVAFFLYRKSCTLPEVAVSYDKKDYLYFGLDIVILLIASIVGLFVYT